MSGFDPEQYFNKAYAGTLGSDSIESIATFRTTKERELAAASARKVAQLEAKQTQLRINEQALVGKLGLSPDSFPGQVVDSVAATVNDAAGAAGSVVGAYLDAAGKPVEAERARELANLDSLVAVDEEGNRTSGLHRRNIGDTAVTAVKSAIAVPELAVGLADIPTLGRAGKLLKEWGFKPKEAKASLNELYSHEQQQANQNVQQADGFGATLEALAEDPSVVAHTVGDSIAPMLAGGVVAKGVAALAPKLAGVVSTAIGEGTVMAGSAAENIRQQNADGHLDGGDVLAVLGTGLMGGLVGVGGAKLSELARVGDIDTAIATGALARSERGPVARTTIGGAIEGGEELAQSTGEKVLENLALERPWDEGVGSAAAMGLVTGTAMGAPMNAVSPGPVKAAKTNTRDMPEETPVAAPVWEQATTTGDVTALTDKASPHYAPGKGIAALMEFSKKADLPMETKQAKLAEAGAIVESMQATLDSVVQAQDPAAVQAEMDTYQSTLETLDPADPKRPLYEQAIAQLAEQKATLDKRPVAQVKRDGLYQERLARDLAEARKVFTGFEQQVTPLDTKMDVPAAMAEANVDLTDASPEVGQQAQTSTTKLVRLAMMSPTSFSPDDALQLANNPSNALTAPQREYLTQFAAARQAEAELTKIGTVTNEVLYGDPELNQLGIVNYRANLGKALAVNNPQAAQRQLAGLSTFARGHAQKASMVKAAMAEASMERAVELIRLESGEWVHAAAPVPQDEQYPGKYLSIHPIKSAKMVKAIDVEAAALQAAMTEMSSAYALRFSKAKAPIVPVAQATPAAAPTTPVAAPATPEPVAEAQVASTPEVEPQANTEEGAEPTSSADTEQAPEPEPSDVTTVSEPEPAAAAKPYRLKLFEQDSPEPVTAANYTIRNLVAAFFKQDAKRKSDTSARPLASTENFRSQWAAGEVLLDDYLPPQDSNASSELQERQGYALDLFQQLAQPWVEALGKYVVKGKANAARNDAAYNYRDPLQFFLDEDGKLEENVETAILAAAYSWVAENASASPYNTNEVINKLVGLKKDDKAPGAVYSLLREVGDRDHMVTQSLGKRAVEVLGLKAKADAPQNLKTQIEGAFGTLAMAMLVELDILEPVDIPNIELQKALGKADGNPKGWDSFVRFKRNAAAEVSQSAADILEANKNTRAVFDQVFSVESGLKEPSLVPVDFSQASTGLGDQEVPATLAAQLEQKGHEAHRVRKGMWSVVDQMAPDLMVEILGGVDTDAIPVQASRRFSVKAKNDGLAREYQRAMDYIKGTLLASEQGLEQPVYFDFSVWVQQRVGFITNVLNPQTSKFVRHLLAMDGWDTTVHLDNTGEMQNFWLRVAEGLGIKVERKDSPSSMKDLKKKLESPTTLKAVQALRKTLRTETLDIEDQLAIAEAVKLGKKGMHSLDALLALTEYKEAVSQKATEFNTQLTAEIDGVNNGPILANLLFGAASTVEEMFDRLNKGGMYTDTDLNTQFNLWRNQPGQSDLYESLTKLIDSHVNKDSDYAVVSAFTGELISAAGEVTGDGRDMSKIPSTTVVFGSGVSKILANMQGIFVDSVYGKIEALARKGDTAAPAEVARVVKNINHLLSMGRGNVDLLPAKTSLHDLMELQFTSAQERALMEAYNTVFGKPVRDALHENFTEFLAARDEMTRHSNLAFHLYDSVYQAKRDELLAQLVRSGEVAVNAKGEPIRDLSRKQEQALRDELKSLAPVMHTAMSQESKQLSAGMFIGKSKQKRSEAAAYQSQVQLAKPLKGSKNKARSRALSGYVRVDAEPGVKMVPFSTHSSDSAVSHEDMDAVTALNVHDAKVTGLGQADLVAHNLNRATWKHMLNYSPASAVYDALAHQVGVLHGMMLKGQLPDAAVHGILNHAESIPDLLAGAKFEAARADKMKFATMAHMGSVDQYAFEGGAYPVTAQDRKQARTMGEAVTPEVPTELMEQAEQLQRYLTKLETVEQKRAAKQAAIEQAAEQLLADSPIWTLSPLRGVQLVEQALRTPGLSHKQTRQLEDVLQAQTKDGLTLREAIDKKITAREQPGVVRLLVTQQSAAAESWKNDLGQPSVASNPAWVDFFEAQPQRTVAEVLAHLQQQIHKDDLPRNIKEFRAKTLAAVKKLVNPALTFEYLTPERHAGTVPGGPVSNARGWYDVSTESEHIYIRSPDFLASGVDSELVLHELLHAALLQATHRSDSDPAAGELMANLDSLRTNVETFLYNKPELQAKFAPAIKNVDELISWGMTNVAFMTEVLAKVQVPVDTTGNRFVTGMRSFIDSLMGFLFRSSSKTEGERLATGLGVLITNVGGLFAYAAETREQRMVAVTRLAMENPQDQVAGFSSQQVLDALAAQGLDPAFKPKLDELLAVIVDKVRGPMSAFLATAGATPASQFKDAVAAGDVPFVDSASQANLPISEAEAFLASQVEASVLAVLQHKDAPSTTAHTLLSRLYQETRARLKDQRSQNPELFAFVFGNTDQSGPARLARFAAMALAYQPLNTLMQAPSTQVNKRFSGMTLAEKAMQVLELVLEWVNGKLTRTTPGQRLDRKILTLVEDLVLIQDKAVRREAMRRSPIAVAIDRYTELASDKAREQVGQFMDSKFFSESKHTGLKLLGKVGSLAAHDRLGYLQETLVKFRDTQIKGKYGTIAGVFNEMKGQVDDNLRLMNVFNITKINEQKREQISEDVERSVLDSFENGGDLLTQDHQHALSMALRVDLSALLVDDTSMDDLLEQVRNPQKFIDALEAKMPAGPHQQYYLETAELSGYLLVTGEAKRGNLMLNAGNIAYLSGHADEGKVSTQVREQVTPIIDQLMTLYGIKYMPAVDRTALLDVMAQEGQRGAENGVEVTLRTHRFQQDDAAARIFNGPALMTKGYLPEVYDHHVEVKAAAGEEARDMERLGWKPIGLLDKDPADPDRKNKTLYVLKDGGLQTRQSGALSLTGLHAKGTTVHNGSFSHLSQDVNTSRQQKTKWVQAQHKAAVSRAHARIRPLDVEGTYMVPVLNDIGEVANHRYMMKQRTRDDVSVLARNNDFAFLLGRMAGSTFDKETSPEHNARIIEALKAQHDEEFTQRHEAYVMVGPDSPDPELQESYRLLPDSTKEEIQKVWGSQNMVVRVDLLDLTFGYRKRSLAESFYKSPDEREKWEQLMVNMVSAMLNPKLAFEKDPKGIEAREKRTAIQLRQGGEVWSFLVKEAKDMLVVKNIGTIVGNIVSNWSLLWLRGVGLSDMVHHHRVALKGIMTYEAERKALAKLQHLQNIGLVQGQQALADLAHDIAVLEGSLAGNPVHELVKAGLLPSIVEDVESDDPYAFKSLLQRTLDPYTAKVPKPLRSAAKFLYMTHDQPMYQMLSKATKYSDFVARYTMVQHLTTRDKNPLSMEAAIKEAREAFINYDLPSHRNVQWLNDAGFLMFTKYYLRIQKVLIALFRENPAKELLMVATSGFIDALPLVTDSLMLNRLGNPLQDGVMEFIQALDETTIMKMLPFVK